MKAIGFNLGQRGDLIMNTVVARAFKDAYPDSQLILGVGPQYADMIDLFKHHPYIDGVHVYEGYDNWPTIKDITYLNDSKYDLVFNGMARHAFNNWYQMFHQCEEACLMHFLKPPQDISCILTDHFQLSRQNKRVAFAPFAGYYNVNNNKKLSIENAQRIVDFLHQRGYTVVQLGGHDEPALENTIFEHRSYVDSVKEILKSHFYIGTDTGLTWVASAYKHPSIVFYSNEQYGKKVTSIQPKNIHGRYYDGVNLNELNFESILLQDLRYL